MLPPVWEMVVPLFYFDIRDGKFIPDVGGEDLPDVEAARLRGAELCQELLTGNPAEFWQGEAWEVVVRDESGLAVFTIAFTATAMPSTRPALACV